MKKTIICFVMGAMIMSCNSTNINVENEKASLTNDVTIFAIIWMM